MLLFWCQAEDGIRDLVRSRGLGDVYKRQHVDGAEPGVVAPEQDLRLGPEGGPHAGHREEIDLPLSLIHI